MKHPDDRAASESLLSSLKDDVPEYSLPPGDPRTAWSPPHQSQLLYPPEKSCDIEAAILSAMRSGDAHAFASALRRHDAAFTSSSSLASASNVPETPLSNHAAPNFTLQNPKKSNCCSSQVLTSLSITITPTISSTSQFPTTPPIPATAPILSPSSNTPKTPSFLTAPKWPKTRSSTPSPTSATPPQWPAPGSAPTPEASPPPPPALTRCLSAACSAPRLAPFLPPLLRARGVQPNAPLRTRAAGAAPLPPLHAAAASSNPGAVAALLADPRTSPGLLDEACRTALHHAVVPRREDCLERARACVLLLLGQAAPSAWAGDGGACAAAAAAAAGEAGAPGSRAAFDRSRALVDVDAADVYKCTALHYAARYADQSMVMTLLRCGAFYGVRDRYGHSAIVDIGSSTLEAHLDECLRSKNAKSPYDYMYTMIYTFSFLPNSPTHVSKECKRMGVPDAESCCTKLCVYASEMDVLYELSHLRCSRHLLKHPVVTLFLNMKWHRIKSIFYCNIIIYTAFLLLLNYHIIRRPHASCVGDQKQENVTEPATPSTNVPAECTDGLHIVLEILLIICLILFLAREGLQIMISCRKHIHTTELYVKIFLTAFTIAALFMPNNKARQHVSALAVLLSWIGLFFLTGNMPLLSIQLEMLKKVCLTFIKFMTWYSILVIGFSFSFCILLNNGEKYASGSVHSFFLDPWRAIFKTVIMMAGEFDAIDLPLSTYPVTSHIIFIIFVFLISIVLLNLLNGLAVSDTQAIKEEAEVYSLVARVRTISQIETSLLHIRNSRVLKLLTKLPFVQRFYDNIFIFPYFHHVKQMRIYPNWKENNVVISRPNDSNEYTHCCTWTFKQSVNAAIYLIMKSSKRCAVNLNAFEEMKRLRREMRDWMATMERRFQAPFDCYRKRGHRLSRRSHASTKTC